MFSPEMLADQGGYCSQRLLFLASLHKGQDTVNKISHGAPTQIPVNRLGFGNSLQIMSPLDFREPFPTGHLILRPSKPLKVNEDTD